MNVFERTAADSAESREGLEGPVLAGGVVSEVGAMERSRRRWDPRVYQIAALSVLLVYGYARLQFDIAAENVALILCVALATQYFCTRFWRLPVFDPRSALISGLSLSLLLRANSVWWLGLAAAVSIAGKFVFRWNGKHLFNPTNFGIVAMMLCPGGNVWVCPGQWGNCAFFGFLLICLGGIVVNRARRADVTFAFLASYLGLVFGRSIWLGEPMAIPLHRIENGALLIFAFFMISDPRTTPNSRAGRILFAGLVAFGGWYVQYRLFRTNGLLWSLAGFALVGPLIDFLLPGDRFEWGSSKSCRSTPVANFCRPSGALTVMTTNPGLTPGANFWQALRANLGEALRGNFGWALRSTFWQALRGNFGQALRSNFGRALRGNFGWALRSTFWQALRGNFGRALRSNFGWALRGNFWQALRGNFGWALRGNFGWALRGNFGWALRGNLWQALRSNLWQALRANLGRALRGNFWQAVRDNLWSRFNLKRFKPASDQERYYQ